MLVAGEDVEGEEVGVDGVAHQGEVGCFFGVGGVRRVEAGFTGEEQGVLSGDGLRAEVVELTVEGMSGVAVVAGLGCAYWLVEEAGEEEAVGLSEKRLLGVAL
jgi:hypothetical protein